MIFEGIGMGTISLTCPFCSREHHNVQLVEEVVVCLCGSTMMSRADEAEEVVVGCWQRYDVLARRTERFLSDDPRNYC